MITIRPKPFDPWQEMQSYRSSVAGFAGQFGATNVFIGTLRDFNENEQVKTMTLEHYPGMTEKQLSTIVDEARERWPILDALVIHRVGVILPNDTIVLVAVWSSHRGDAFDACRYIMEALKSRAPFWKKETLQSDQQRWVLKNTNGYQN
jgi:molybdopterin synthase catalytic subunit